MTDLYIRPGDAPDMLAKLIDEILSGPPDYADIPVVPEDLGEVERKAFEYLVREAAQGNTDVVFESVAETEAERDFLTRSFELDYLLGKILFYHKSYHEASKYFEKALTRFEGYGELWFLAGVADYVMGAWGRAFMKWTEAVKVNANHKDARIVLNLANTMMKNTHRHLNPEAEPMLPLVEGRGIDVGCGGAKTSPEAIGVDITPPGKSGAETSQRQMTSQADVQASGDNLYMFADDSLDYVIARHNLEHYADPVRALSEWTRVLKPGGVLGLVLPDDEAFDTLRADPAHKSAFTRASLCSLVSLIPGLSIVEQGTCQNEWSIYLVAEKTAPGAKASYPYRKKLNRMIAAGVLKRAELAVMAGMNDTAAAALRKARELDPDAELPADPDELHPFPFPGEPPFHVSRERGGRRVALACGHASSFGWLDVLERIGNSVIEIPMAEKGGVTWSQELVLRDFAPEVFITPVYDFRVAERMALMGIPYAAWEYGRRRGKIEWRRGLMDKTIFIFSSSPSELARYKRLGAENVHVLPPGVDTGVVKRGALNSKREAAVLYLERPEWENRYPGFMERIKKELTGRGLPVESKDALFGWLRGFRRIMERQLENYGDWIIPRLWEEEAQGAPPLGGVFSEEDIQAILGEEVSARILGAVAEGLGDLFSAASGSAGDYWRPFDPESYPDIYFNAKVNLAHDAAAPWDAAPLRALEIMACGGFALAERRAAWEGVLAEGEDFACYSTPEEAREKARYYLDHPEERERVAEAGYRKVIENHTLEKRFQEIFKTLGEAGVLGS
ncbi:MAG: glycosyltransferase family protein [Candidatus Nitrospinota bacterium M3_3B_026]